MQFCRDLVEGLSHLVNRSSIKPGLEVGIKIASCRLKGNISFGVRNSCLKVVWGLWGSRRRDCVSTPV